MYLVVILKADERSLYGPKNRNGSRGWDTDAMKCFKESGTTKTRLDVTQVLSRDVEDNVKSSTRLR